MQAGKILGLVVGGVIAVAALLLAAVWLFVDPNSYAPELAAAVKDATGRELTLQGKMRLSVLPWPALELNSVTLGNPAGFGGDPFVAVRHATFRARLLPLVQKRLEIDRIELDGVEVRLLEHDGRGNWQGLVGGVAPAATASGMASPGPGSPAGRAFARLASLKITHGRVTFRGYTLANLTVETGSFAQDALAPVTIHVDADRGRAGETSSVDAQFNLSADPHAGHFRVAALTVHGLAMLAGHVRPLRWGISTPALDLDLAAQTLIAPVLDLTVAGALLNGNLVGHGLPEAPTWSGALTLDPLILREFLPRLAITPPWTQDPKAFALLAGSASFGYAGHEFKLDDVKMTLDDTHITGHAAFADDDAPTLQFALAADHVDWDRYAAPAGAVASQKPTAPVAERAALAAPSVDEQGLEVDGTLAVGELHRAPFDLTAVRVTLIDSGGVLHLYPLRAQIDGGEYTGNINIDRRGVQPTLTFDEHVTGIDLKSLNQGKTVHVSGRGNVNFKGTAHGAGDWLSTVDGHLDAVVTGGAVEGIDIGYQLARGESLLRREEEPLREDTHRTPFDTLKVSAQVNHGVARTEELAFSSQALKVTGQGTVNLTGQALDFSLLVDTLRSLGDIPLVIPVKVTGSVANPTVRPDFDALFKGGLRQRIEGVLKDKLKELFKR
jgi:AsmA protein